LVRSNIDIGQLSALDEIAEAYGHVDAGTRVRILINIARYRDAHRRKISQKQVAIVRRRGAK